VKGENENARGKDEEKKEKKRKGRLLNAGCPLTSPVQSGLVWPSQVTSSSVLQWGYECGGEFYVIIVIVGTKGRKKKRKGVGFTSAL